MCIYAKLAYQNVSKQLNKIRGYGRVTIRAPRQNKLLEHAVDLQLDPLTQRQ